LGIKVIFDKETPKENRDKILLKVAGQYLTNLKAILMIDGPPCANMRWYNSP
jgi:hypothetical protein